jgi:hypothetical protein
MTLGRAAAAIGVVVVTTVWAEGTSLVTAPLGASLWSLRHSPAGSGSPVGQASLTTPTSAFTPKLDGRLLERRKQCFVARL